MVKHNQLYSSSGLVPGYNDTNDNVTQVDFNPDIIQNTGLSVNIAATNNVKDLNHATMREKLISHFDILFTKGDVHWPRG